MQTRNPFTYDAALASSESALDCQDASLTQQHHADDCDINEILRRFNVTGHLPNVENNNPQYVDVTDIPSLQDALNTRAEIAGRFSRLSSVDRAKYGNDVKNFVNVELQAVEASIAANKAAIQADLDAALAANKTGGEPA